MSNRRRSVSVARPDEPEQWALAGGREEVEQAAGACRQDPPGPAVTPGEQRRETRREPGEPPQRPEPERELRDPRLLVEPDEGGLLERLRPNPRAIEERPRSRVADVLVVADVLDRGEHRLE